MTDQPSRPGPPQWAAIVVLGIIWGGTFLGVKIALEGFAPLWVAAGRVTLAAALLGALMVTERGPLRRLEERVEPGARRETDRRRWPYLLGMGAIGAAAPFVLLAEGQQSVSSAFAGVSMAAIPLFILPLSAIFVPGEGFSWFKGIGVALGFAGVVALFWTRFGGESSALLGQAMCVGAAGCYAVGSIITRLCPPIPLVAQTAAKLGIGAALVLPAAFLIEGMPALPGWRPITALVLLALLPTAGAQLLRMFVIRTAGAQFMSLTNYQVPVWAVVFGVAFAGESAPSTLLIGMGLILAGIAATQAPAIRGAMRARRGAA